MKVISIDYVNTGLGNLESKERQMLRIKYDNGDVQFVQLLDRFVLPLNKDLYKLEE